MEQLGLFLYYVLFFATIAFAIGMLLSKDTIRSAVALIGVMVSLAVNFLIMRQEFVAFIQIIVYAGAIMVLVLFVIMLLNLKESETTPWYLKSTRFWGGALALSFFVIMGVSLWFFLGDAPTPGAVAVEAKLQESGIPQVYPLANMMISEYVVPFLLTSILLLVAVIGAIVLARRKDEDGNEIEIEEEIA